MRKKYRTKQEKKPRKPKRVVQQTSDDEYDRSVKPDKTEDSYYHDDVDEFHSNRDKILLEEGAEIAEPEELSEEEVLALDSSSDDDDGDDGEIEAYAKQLRRMNVSRFKDEHASDISGAEDSDDDVGDGRAWGSKRSQFYGADFVDDRGIEFSGERVDPHLLEEQEAVAMEKRMAEQLDEADFGLDIFQTPEEDDQEKTVGESERQDAVRIEKDLSLLSKHEKLKLLQKESPEMLTLVQDFKDKLREAKERYLPIYAHIKNGTLANSKGTEYIQAKVRLLLNYCVNISFYLMLKAKRTSVHNHPVIKRLLQYRNLMQEMEACDKVLSPEVDALLTKVKAGESLAVANPPPDVQATYLRRKNEQEARKEMKAKKTNVKKKKKLSALLDEEQTIESSGAVPEGGRTWGRKRSRDEGRYATSGEKQALEYYALMKTGKRSKTEDEGVGEAGEMADPDTTTPADGAEGGGASDDEQMGGVNSDGEEGKRAITYEMAKNKGLMPKRKKEQRNPRVKNRLKYRKAKIRRRGQVREVRTEMTRYAGELSGIRAGIRKSTKFRT